MHIYINTIPASYLKGFRTSVMPNCDEGMRFRKVEKDYFLDFEGHWDDWYSKKREVRQLNIHILCENTLIVKEVFSCCRVIWIKKLLENTGDLEKGEVYVLYCNSLPLDDAIAVADYGLSEENTIDAIGSADLVEGPSSLQMATGNRYYSVEDFGKYMAQMSKKIDIVCQISIPKGRLPCEYGTGFLIGHYLIMTNQHVVKGGLRGATAKFLYHGTDQEEMDIPLCEEIVCESQSPGKNLPVKSGRLDYAILRLTLPPYMYSQRLKALQNLNSVATKFFEEAFERFEKKNRPSNLSTLQRIKHEELRMKRANIIQHPLLEVTCSDKLPQPKQKVSQPQKVPQPKQIAFRENRIHSYDRLMLHYESATKLGSSGSPVLNDEGEWIGLHYAACNLIDTKLFAHVINLCRVFNYYQHSDTSSKTFCFAKGIKRLYVHRQQEHKGSFSYDTRNAEKFNLRKLILEESEEVKAKGISLAQFILRFLQEQNEKVEDYHVYCNTAVMVDSIFVDLNAKAAEKKQKMEAAGALAKKEWSVFAQLSAKERALLARLSKKHRRFYVSLTKKEKSFYTGLDKGEREGFFQLTEKERAELIERMNAAKALAKKEWSIFAQLSEKERALLAQLSKKHRRFYVSLTEKEKSFYTGLDKGEREGFFQLTEKERAELIESKNYLWQRYKWPLLAGCIFIVGGLIYYKSSKK